MNELIAWAVAVIVGLGGAWIMGRKSGENKQVKKEYDMMRDAAKVGIEHDKKNIDDVRANSASKWVRRDG